MEATTPDAAVPTQRASGRIERAFARCAEALRPALVTFVTAGDPDTETSQAILEALPGAGADIIELGMPFSDPMAEGPPIQRASQRALKAGQTMHRTLQMVTRFRDGDAETPIVLMGYYNPIYRFGVERFLEEAVRAGVDGLIVVDLPPEADDELCIPALRRGIAFIRLATPTTDDARLPAVLTNTAGFVYYVSMTGVTGVGTPDTTRVAEAVARIKAKTDLPVAVGFGVKTPEQAGAIGRTADAVVVGSALVEAVRETLDADGRGGPRTAEAVVELVEALARGVMASRQMALQGDEA